VFDTPCQSTWSIKFGLWLFSGLRTLNCSECLKDYYFLMHGMVIELFIQIRAGFATFLLLVTGESRRAMLTVGAFQLHFIHGDQA